MKYSGGENWGEESLVRSVKDSGKRGGRASSGMGRKEEEGSQVSKFPSQLHQKEKSRTNFSVEGEGHVLFKL